MSDNPFVKHAKQLAALYERVLERRRSWIEEDFHLENGQYQNKCCICDKLFQGHKRRVSCKLCQQ